MDILFFLIIIGVIIFAIYKYNKKTNEENRIREEQERIRAQKRYEEQQKRAAEEIINSTEFQHSLNHLNCFYRIFTLAGGTDPFLPPIIKLSKEDKREILLEKQGYDLYKNNLEEYYNTRAPQCYEALNRFGVDLFGEYAEEIKSMISLEWIADHMIELTPRTCSSSNFTLHIGEIVSCNPEWKYDGDIRLLYKQEVKFIDTPMKFKKF